MPPPLDCGFFRVAAPHEARAAALAWERARAAAGRIRDQSDRVEARRYASSAGAPRAVEARRHVHGQRRHVGHDAALHGE